MSKPKLNHEDFARAAKKLKCEIAAIRAVAHVESRGEGFYSDGFPVILFERHKFRQFTNGKYNASHPDISGPAGNYGAAGQHQRNKFKQAFALNPAAAMKACSWGKFQIMGFNHAVCGYATVDEFIDAMKESEGKHLDAFVNFVINNGLADELRNLNWKGFARGYNGAGYAQNKYDTKMASAYINFSKNPTPHPPDKPARNPLKSEAALNGAALESVDTGRIDEIVTLGSPVEIKRTEEIKTPDGKLTEETTTASAMPNVVIEKREELGFFASIWKKITGLAIFNGGMDALTEKAQQVQALGLSPAFWTKIGYLVLVGTLVYLLFEAYRHFSRIREEHERDLVLARENSTPTNFVQFAKTEYLPEFKAAGYKVITR